VTGELTLLSMRRADALALHRRALNRDLTAMAEFVALWDGRGDLVCFICDHTVEPPPFTQILPEFRSDATVMLAPLCLACRSLSELQRVGRSLKILKKMYSRRSSLRSGRQKNVTFAFNKSR
jgi:hypothetical protein